MTQAIAARDSLGLQTPLSFAIACMASRNFPFVNRTDTMQMAAAAMAISRAHKNVEVFWDQHTNGDQLNAPTSPRDFVSIFEEERDCTEAWVGESIPIVVLEENGTNF